MSARHRPREAESAPNTLRLSLHPSSDRSREHPARALGLALDATSDAFLLLDERWTVRAANANASRVVGLSGESLVGRPFPSLLPEPAAAVVRPLLEGAAHGHRRSADFPVGDGGSWCVAHSYPAPGGILLHLHDVTERHEAENELAFLAHAGKALADVLDERRLTRVVGRLTVPRLADWCLFVLQDRGGPPRIVATASDRALRRRLLARAARETGGEGAHELLSAPRSGGAIVLGPSSRSLDAPNAGLWSLAGSAVKVPLVHSTKGVVGHLVFGRVRGRAPFRGIDVQLATALGSRISNLLEKVRLYEAEQRATRLRDDVLAIVAHDLRNPLNTVMLAATALATRPAEERALHETARQTIVAAAEQMHGLVEDLLDAARLDGGWGPRERTAVDVAELVETSSQSFRWRAAQRGVRLESVVRGTRRMRVRGDAARLAEAVANLLDNAVKFTPSGGTVTLTAERVREGIRLSVADTGRGIDPAAMPRLFDRFWQARENGRANAGLGLFIAHRIVAGHGGRLTAESVPGEGSVFHIVLPTRTRSAKGVASARGQTRSERS